MRFKFILLLVALHLCHVTHQRILAIKDKSTGSKTDKLKKKSKSHKLQNNTDLPTSQKKTSKSLTLKKASIKSSKSRQLKNLKTKKTKSKKTPKSLHSKTKKATRKLKTKHKLKSKKKKSRKLKKKNLLQKRTSKHKKHKKHRKLNEDEDGEDHHDLVQGLNDGEEEGEQLTGNEEQLFDENLEAVPPEPLEEDEHKVIDMSNGKELGRELLMSEIEFPRIGIVNLDSGDFLLNIS